MQITCLGHAGLHIETRCGTILCDPWKNPAYFDSWFVFPDNSDLDWDRYGKADYLYVSHLHKDHFDPQNLREHVSRDATVLLPDFPVPDLRNELESLGFSQFIVLPSGQEVEVDGLRLMIQALQAPVDGPLGDSALAVDDGTACILNQNDARPVDLDPLQSFGPYDVHFLQFSGAIWWPWTYELPQAAQRSFGAAKRANGLDRATRFVKAIGARYVVPSAGPACFLDEDLFELNDVNGDSCEHLPRPPGVPGLPPRPRHRGRHAADPRRGARGRLRPARGALARHHGAGHGAVHRQGGLPARLRGEEAGPDRRRQAQLAGAGVDVLAELKAWFEPLLELAGHIRAGVGGPVLLRLGDGRPIVIDFPAGEVRAYAGETCRYQFTVDRALVERLIADHQTDWVNSLFLSLRFRARRIGPYNEYVYTFFKCLAPDRLMYAEGWYADKTHDEEDIRLDDWIMQRRCPHLRGDLSRFGEISGTTLTCTVHGWQFDLDTGKCLSTDDDSYKLRCRPALDERAARA